ncbi:hypothetical protein GOODEAATRI_030075 [Goodea atripinnis]|uniref:Uncharacterized protein n=1 Tax=Goodea atripinnis TaxID=208336 RepID=A0ABV0MWB3_9TELE
MEIDTHTHPLQKCPLPLCTGQGRKDSTARKMRKLFKKKSLITCFSLNASSFSIVIQQLHTRPPMPGEREGKEHIGTRKEKEDVLEDTWKTKPPTFPKTHMHTPTPPLPCHQRAIFTSHK